MYFLCPQSSLALVQTMSASYPLTLEARAAAVDELERQFHLQRQGRNDKFTSMGFAHEDRVSVKVTMRLA